jgi:Amt family ammonium transporter
MTADFSMVDGIWILVCTGLVFAMQAGFLCLESGLTRSKDAINVALKNMTDFSVSLLLFWAFGFALMFGASEAGWFGTSHFFVPMAGQSSGLTTTFLFQAMFCATAATIVSGAVAGRMRFAAYIIITLIVSGLVYPVFGHWAWGGAIEGPAGWLAARGFVDFAGSTVVHGVGAWAGLAAILVIGPRIGRFPKDQAPKPVPGSNMPMAMLGTLLLWMGWIGFNGGSTLEMNGEVAGIIGNTFLSGAAGMLTALVVGWLVLGHADVNLAINGSLAGLVAITAGCHAVTAPSAVVIGAIGAVVMMGAHWILERRQVDDAIGAVPVHGAAGVWGTIAVALFGMPEILGTGLSRWAQLQIQLTGIFVAFALTFGTTYLLLRLIHSLFPLRVTPEQEQVGLNVSEHGASTELYELLVEMEFQRQSGDFSPKVTVEPGSDVGQIAAQYNRVLDKVTVETKNAIRMAETADLSRQQTEQACAELETTVAELREFNELSEGREQRMIGLKMEVNEFAGKLGQPQPYDVCPHQNEACQTADER